MMCKAGTVKLFIVSCINNCQSFSWVLIFRQHLYILSYLNKCGNRRNNSLCVVALKAAKTVDIEIDLQGKDLAVLLMWNLWGMDGY